MATLERLPGVEGFIRERVEKRGLSHKDISLQLKILYPTLRRTSAASVRRYCREHVIHKTARLDRSSLDRLVSLNVLRVRCLMGVRMVRNA